MNNSLNHDSPATDSWQACRVAIDKHQNCHHCSPEQGTLPPARKWLQPGVGVPVRASTWLFPWWAMPLLLWRTLTC